MSDGVASNGRENKTGQTSRHVTMRRVRLTIVVMEMQNVLHTVWRTLLVAQLVEALRYKPEGGGFDFRWCLWNFPLT
jgi:hypothetical protein